MPSDGDALWNFVAGLSMDDLTSLLAHCGSLSLNAVQRPGDCARSATLSHAAVLAATMRRDLTRYWQPTASGYLGRVSKDLILDAVREAAGDEAARRLDGLKKQAMAERAEELLAGKGWLPPLLSSSLSQP